MTHVDHIKLEVALDEILQDLNRGVVQLKVVATGEKPVTAPPRPSREVGIILRVISNLPEVIQPPQHTDWEDDFIEKELQGICVNLHKR